MRKQGFRIQSCCTVQLQNNLPPQHTRKKPSEIYIGNMEGEQSTGGSWNHTSLVERVNLDLFNTQQAVRSLDSAGPG